MKIKFCITLFLSVILVSCTKGKIADNTIYLKAPSKLIGSWNWNITYGGIALFKYDPVSTGKSIKIELDSLSTYKYFSNDSLKFESKFRIAKTISIFNHEDSVLQILIDPNPYYMKNLSKSWSDFIFSCYFSFRSTDTLIFTDPSFDGFDHTYSKIK
jgi:hypothetical protein